MRSLTILRQAVLAAGVAAALGFGATTALARPAPPCDNPFAEGTCRNLSDCQSLCASRGFQRDASACRDRCCFCNVI